ncbi:2-oxo acid dehydrogenase subunit E2 [Novosphingobium aquae]|uniref:Dihydrolipoamide acetyltransferase component of pyruvate dehydrogenase complex n=1 Tax=Novosphingobium aquae TaxID=3133435 RepID=A0ABU8S514_9SPHN
MPIAIKMPALSPTMEEGKLARWLVKVGDTVSSGDIMAEIETDKATMEFEAVDEGTILSIEVAEGTEGVKVGTVIAQLGAEGEAAAPAAATPVPEPAHAPDVAPEPAPVAAPEAPAVLISPKAKKLAEEWGLDITAIKGTGPNGRIVQSDVEGAKGSAPKAAPAASPAPATPAAPAAVSGARVIASPLAKRIAAERGVDLASVKGSGPNGRIVRADVENAPIGAAAPASAASAAANVPTVDMAAETRALLDDRIPHSVEKLSGMRKTIARRLAQSMSEAPHIYLTVDVQLDKLLKLRGELNAVLEKEGVKLSVNDMLVKALGKALVAVPECNVTFAGNEMIRYARADISVAVSIPGGLITPIVQDANGRSLASIATAMKDLGSRAKEGKLQPGEYQGGTASISNMGMMGIKHFTAVINPPQSTILAVGAGEKRPWVMSDGSLGVANVMTVTGSFDHRAVDGADGARLMSAFRELVESPLGLVV